MLGGKNNEIVSFAPVRAKIKSFKGTKKEVIEILSDIISYCSYLLNRVKSKEESLILSYIFTVSRDIMTLEKRSNIVCIETRKLLLQGNMELLNKRLYQFYDLCDQVGILLDR